ncbi:MAG: hypothetical protein QY331_09125 [Melioribacteraceae bacterium]|nr:MAG: hypothetical protein QY331_09125 [Melioribacteraceae bacterium]
MRKLENRLKRIEEILLPKKQTVITIDYKTSESKSSVDIEGKKFEIPKGTNLVDFIIEKIESLRLNGIITCIVYTEI